MTNPNEKSSDDLSKMFIWNGKKTKHQKHIVVFYIVWQANAYDGCSWGSELSWFFFFFSIHPPWGIATCLTDLKPASVVRQASSHSWTGRGTAKTALSPKQTFPTTICMCPCLYRGRSFISWRPLWKGTCVIWEMLSQAIMNHIIKLVG